jgi:hypothetical protein
MKNTIVELIILSNDQLKNRLTQLIKYIACTFEPIRHNRSYARIKRRPNSQPFYILYERLFSALMSEERYPIPT